MRLLLLSLLALGAQAQLIGHRSLLQAFSPARGEFPVRSELAQGYLRYLDSTGAERLVAYAYPEPLYGIRSEHQVLQQPNTLLRSGFLNTQPSNKEALPVLTPEVQLARDEHLRIWQETAQASQTPKELKPQEIPITLNYNPQSPPMPVQETQEVLRARQEHLRLYNEALQLQSQTSTTQTENQALKTVTYQNIEQPQLPQPVQETPEVQRAREEHLKQYNEAILRQSAEAAIPQQSAIDLATKSGIVELYAPLANTLAQPLTTDNAPLPTITIRNTILSEPQPIGNIANSKPFVQTAPEITINTKSSFSNEAQPILNSIPYVLPAPPLPTLQLPSQPAPPLPTVQYPRLPVAQTATPEQKIEFLNRIKLTAEDNVADIDDRIRLEEREREAERLRDLEQRREEQKREQLERQREEQRLTEERNLLEAERIALQQQEKQRLEEERQVELKRLQAEQQLELQQQQQQQQLELQQQEQQQQQLKTTVEQIFNAPAPAKPQAATAAAPAQPLAISQQQQVQNGFFLRIQAVQPAAAAAQELNSDAYLLAEQTHNPFLLRHIQGPQQQVKTLSEPALPSFQSAAIAPSSISNRPLPEGLSQLEQANREHFKAHEIALEQLRLAQTNNPVAAPCQ